MQQKPGCSIYKYLKLEKGGIEDYKQLSHLHYRDSKLGPYTAIYVLRMSRVKVPAGVIVYTMPTPGLELRNIACGNIFSNMDASSRLTIINKNIRCINRVIIEPRFRSIGLASLIVRETMELMDVAIIEALAVMGHVNGFFEKAGMTAYKAGPCERSVRLIEAFSFVGIEDNELIDASTVEQKLNNLSKEMSEFIEGQIRRFMQSYGKRRYQQRGIERTRFVLGKLGYRPVYYVWFNPKVNLVTS